MVSVILAIWIIAAAIYVSGAGERAFIARLDAAAKRIEEAERVADPTAKAKLLEQSEREFRRLAEASPADPESQYYIGTALRYRAELTSGTAAYDLYRQAVGRYDTSEELLSRKMRANATNDSNTQKWQDELATLVLAGRATALYHQAFFVRRRAESIAILNRGIRDLQRTSGMIQSSSKAWATRQVPKLLGAKAWFTTGTESVQVCAEARAGFEQLLKEQPQKGADLWGLAGVLELEASRLPVQEKLSHYDDAFRAASEAITLAPPEFPTALRMCARVLMNRAFWSPPSERSDLYARAEMYMRRAAAQSPNDPYTLLDQGLLLLSEASVSSGTPAVALCDRAIESFQNVAGGPPFDTYAATNSAFALTWKAVNTTNGSVKSTLDEAIVCANKAQAFDESDAGAVCARGLALSIRAERTTDPAKQRELFTQSETDLRRGLELNPEPATIILARLYAAERAEDKCREWLTRAGELNQLSRRDVLLLDPVWQPFQNKPWFAEIYAKQEARKN